jgi:hypothetical protein
MNRSVVTHHRTAWWRSHRATSRGTAGSVLRRWSGRGGNRVASATRPRVTMPLFQPDENAGGQQDGHRMPMTPQPHATLVWLPAQCPFGLFMTRLDRLPPMGVPGQRFEGGIVGQMAPARLPLLGRPLGGTLPHQPALVTVPVSRHPPAAPRDQLLAPPPLRPLPPAHRAPRPARHALAPLGRPPHGCARQVP